ncbi:GNAT family N-acetyltransferase [Solwaraspora sp. WMMB335]|uniref:GNAT family N-acetyltransferase n=1 Tax=Solwaraspora sp. WMMB335 TaxID=3404118 RepID=UPI003B9514B3
MLGMQDVGHRVVVRRIVGVSGGRPLYTDLLGVLAELTGTELTVLTRHGPQRVARADVHRGKRVPPSADPAVRAAARREAAAIDRLELVADETWPAPTRQRLGDWLLRAADGWTGRANSALPLGDPGRPLPAAVDAVHSWYTRLGLAPQVNVPLPAAADVAAELAGRGWRARRLVLVQTADLADLLQRATDQRSLPPVRLEPTPSPDWLAMVAAGKPVTATTPEPGTPAGPSLPPAAYHVLTAVPQVRFAQVYDGGDLIAVGRGCLSADGRWCGLSLVQVVPAARRRGLAIRLIAAVAGWAHREMGARHAFLQVEQHNPATALYTRLGFTTQHTYLPWQAVSDVPPGGAC